MIATVFGRTNTTAYEYYKGLSIKRITPIQAKVHFDHFIYSLNILKANGIESIYLYKDGNKWTFEEFIRHRHIELIEVE